jgi:hypothetical protein
MPVWIIIVGVIALAIIVSWLLKVRTRRIAEQRAGEGFTEFAAHVAGQDIPREILVDTYNYFENWHAHAVENFPVRATDRIADIYGIVGTDLTDAVEELLTKAGKRWFRETEQPHPPRVETVEDVVLYVASAPLSWQ